MGALGYVMNVPEEEKYLNTKKELEARLVELMAGRAAEEIVFETVTTGAANDIQQATNLPGPWLPSTVCLINSALWDLNPRRTST